MCVNAGKFSSLQGVAQGAVTSPLLHAFYVNARHTRLREQGVGVWLAGTLVPLLLYADDIVLVTDSINALKTSLATLESYAYDWRFEVNNSKSEMVVSASSIAKAAAEIFSWAISGQSLKVSNLYTYLGIEFTGSVSAGNWNRFLERAISKTRSSQALLSYQAAGSDGLRPRTVIGQWKVVCRPKLEYAAELYTGGISNEMINKLESVQSTFGRSVLGLKGSPASAGVRAELGLASLRFRRRKLQLHYWRKLVTGSSSRLLHRVFRYRYQEVRSGLGRFSLVRNFKSTLAAVGLSSYWTSRSAGLDEEIWRDMVWNQCCAQEHAEWLHEVSLCSSLRFYLGIGHTPDLGIPPYLDDRANLSGTRIMSRLRLGTLWVMQRVSKVAGVGISDVCYMCRRDVESPEHFVCDCPGLANQRADLWRILKGRLALAGVVGDAYYEYLEVIWNDLTLRHLWMTLLAGASLASPGDELLNRWASHPSLRREADSLRRVAELVAQSRYIVNYTFKNFLQRCWRVRTETIGTIRLESGVVVCSPPELEPRPFVAASTTVSEHFLADNRLWNPWMDREPKARSTNRARPNANFFVVFRGYNTGVMYKYWDVINSVSGYPKAKFRGFRTLAEAVDAFSKGD